MAGLVGVFATAVAGEVVRRGVDWVADQIFPDVRQPALVPVRK